MTGMLESDMTGEPNGAELDSVQSFRTVVCSILTEPSLVWGANHKAIQLHHAPTLTPLQPAQ